MNATFVRISVEREDGHLGIFAQPYIGKGKGKSTRRGDRSRVQE